MPRRPRSSTKDDVKRISEKLEHLERMSPTLGALLHEWIDRLLAGESLEDIQAEMARVEGVLATVKKPRRR
jgi:hypothetical protein